jgi:hypothetical protein
MEPGAGMLKSITCCRYSLALWFALMIGVGSADAMEAQPPSLADISIAKIVANASMFVVLQTHCAEVLTVDRPAATKRLGQYADVGRARVGDAPFVQLVAAEVTKRRDEIAAAGAATWCKTQQNLLLGLGEHEMFGLRAP